MSFRYQRRYTGPLQAAIFDWSGTLVDFGSRAPVEALVRVFERQGIRVTVEEARRPMGIHKRDHLATMLAMESIAGQWEALNNTAPSYADIDRLYADYLELQSAVVADYATLIPGVLDASERMGAREILLGSTTGYARQVMNSLLPLAEDQGLHPVSVVCADEVTDGRPAPWMAITSAMHMSVYPMAACVKIGDTPYDIEAGLNAGMWTVGVALTGNEWAFQGRSGRVG
ncbi:MAG: phosphonoacetaldehyde hydrolase [Bryobacterales bacterium]|nr:phosphonoacetaldehyde hydrolase [Bryobacterales bacterium]